MRTAALCLSLLVAAPSLAFEGEIHVDIKSAGKESRGRFLRSAAGDTRVDLQMELAGRMMQTSLLVLASNDDVVAQLIHPTKMFERHELQPAPRATDRFGVVKKGASEQAGHKCTEVEITDTKSGDVFTLCVAAGLGDARILDAMHRVLRPGAGSLHAALAAAGVAGFPVRAKVQRKHGGVIEATVVQVEAGPVADAHFELPRGYREGSLTKILRGGGTDKSGVGGLNKLFGR
jgi:hypothetical protein